MEIRKVLLGIGASQYGALNYFIDSIAQGFINLGCIVDIIDFSQTNQIDVTIKYNDYDLVFSFNGIWKQLDNKDQISNANVLYWDFYVDHPMYHVDRLEINMRNQVISFVDEKHMKYVEKYFKNHDKIYFVPHGGEAFGCEIIPFEDRVHDVVMFGSYQDPGQIITKLEQYNDNMKAIIGEVIDSVYYNSYLSLEQALENVINSRGISMADNDFKILMNSLGFVDQFIRCARRTQIIEKLISNGIKVDVYGNGWDNFKTEYFFNLNIHKQVEFERTLEIMSYSKIVLNVMPLFSAGSHERIFNTMGMKSICLTDRSEYLEKEFIDGKDLFFYDYGHLDEVPNVVYNIINQDYDVYGIIENSYNKISEKHLWKNRVQSIIDICKSINIDNEPLIPIRNNYDEQFNCLMNYVKKIDERLLITKMISDYQIHERYIKDLKNSLFASMNTYRFWGTWNPEANDYGVIEERANQLHNNWRKFVELYSMLKDNLSKKILAEVLLYWESSAPCYLHNIIQTENRQYFDTELVNLRSDEVFVDIGAYIGDTTSAFVDIARMKYKKIYCYECSDRNVVELEKTTNSWHSVIIKPYAVGRECGWIDLDFTSEDSSSDRIIVGKSGNTRMVSLDEDIEEPVSFIKMDIEGSEYDAIIGSKNHIEKEKPKLAIAIYHGNEDIWRIPELILSINPEYKLYIRYYGGDLYPNEIVLYAI